MFSNGCCVTRLGIDFIYIDCATAYVARTTLSKILPRKLCFLLNMILCVFNTFEETPCSTSVQRTTEHSDVSKQEAFTMTIFKYTDQHILSSILPTHRSVQV
jgi:hypothetical protein